MANPEENTRSSVSRLALYLTPPLLLAAAVWFTSVSTEPFFGNDETRHLMTGVFFRDLFADGGWRSLRDYTVQYYLQYPALGLLVWPPLFYVIEGAVMLIGGTSLLVGQLVVLGFAAAATIYLAALVARRHSLWTAWTASMLFVLSPIILQYSRQVMLELPALAFMLAAIYHAVVYLDTDASPHLWLAALASACAVMTRFDAAVLAPILLVVVWIRGDWFAIFRARTWVACLAAACVTAPAIWMTAVEFGVVHLSTIVPGSSGTQSILQRTLGTVSYYIVALPEQLGLPLLFAGAAGTAMALSSKARRHQSAPYLATIFATYMVFTLIEEKVPRHTIAFAPAFAALAAIALSEVRRRIGHSIVAWSVTAMIILGTGVSASQLPTPYVRGYRAAAEYVVARTSASRYCLFDGYLEGNFIYQVRHANPERRLWVLRGDKLFYASVINPGNQYTEFVSSDEEMTDLLHSYDPEYIVVESRQPVKELPMGSRLRALLASHPELYELERRIPIEASSPLWRSVDLLIYRKLNRNPTPRSTVDMEMLTLSRPLQPGTPAEPR